LIYDTIIIGSGPAGHSCALYCARAGLNVLMLEGFLAGGVAAGGQLTTTTEIENFLSYVTISGEEFTEKMRSHSLHYGLKIETKTVTEIKDIDKDVKKVYCSNNEYETKTLVIATGSNAKTLSNTKGHKEYWQKGISACAVCDGALPIFRDKPLYVIGGGDTACEESLFLSKFSKEINICIRKDHFRSSKIMEKRVLDHPNIKVHFNTELKEIKGNNKQLSSLVLFNNKNNSDTEVKASGLFYAIGHTPNTDFLNKQIELDEEGYIIEQNQEKGKDCFTSVNGVFACGDVIDKWYRQAIVAAGSGCKAFFALSQYLIK